MISLERRARRNQLAELNYAHWLAVQGLATYQAKCAMTPDYVACTEIKFMPILREACNDQ